jgi:hypothetical protein
MAAERDFGNAAFEKRRTMTVAEELSGLESALLQRTVEKELSALESAIYQRREVGGSGQTDVTSIRMEWLAPCVPWPAPELTDQALSCVSWHRLLRKWGLPLLAETLKTEETQLRAFMEAYWLPPGGPPVGRYSIWVLEEGIRLMVASTQPWLRADGGVLALALLKGLGDAMMKKVDPHSPRRPAQQKCEQATISYKGGADEAKGELDILSLRRSVGSWKGSAGEDVAAHLVTSAICSRMDCGWDAAMAVAEKSKLGRLKLAAHLVRAGFPVAESEIATATYVAAHIARRRTHLRAGIRILRGWGRNIFAAACLEEEGVMEAEVAALRRSTKYHVTRWAREQMHTRERKDWSAFLTETPERNEFTIRAGMRLQVRVSAPLQAADRLPTQLFPFASNGSIFSLRSDTPNEELTCRLFPVGTATDCQKRRLCNAEAQKTAFLLQPLAEQPALTSRVWKCCTSDWISATLSAWDGVTAVLDFENQRLRWRPAAALPQGVMYDCRVEPIQKPIPVTKWAEAEHLPLAQVGASTRDHIGAPGGRTLVIFGDILGEIGFCRARGLPLLASAAPTWRHNSRCLGQGCDCEVTSNCRCPAVEYEEVGKPGKLSWRTDPEAPRFSDCTLIRPSVQWLPGTVHQVPCSRRITRTLQDGNTQKFDSVTSMLLTDLQGEVQTAQWTEEALAMGLAVPPSNFSSEEAMLARKGLRALEHELYLLTDGPALRLCGLGGGKQELLRYWKAEQCALRIASAPRKRHRTDRRLLPPPVPSFAVPLFQGQACPVDGCPGTLSDHDDYNRRRVDEAAAAVLRCGRCGWQRG